MFIKWLPAILLLVGTAFLLLGGIVLAQRQEINALEQTRAQAVSLDPPISRISINSIRTVGCCVLEVQLPGPPLLFTSRGLSMKPMIGGGPWIVVAVPYAEIKVGEVLVYRFAGTDHVVGHRVVEVGYDQNGEWYAETQGTNPETNFQRDPIRVRKEHIIGVRVGGF